jgi:hypothetical protein
MNGKNLEKLISEAISIEAENAKEAGTLGYMARALVQATMPHKNPHSSEAWGRRNGNFSMVMQPGYEMDKKNNLRCIGLPYGTKPRLVMAFVASEAVKTRSKEVILGKSLSEFMRQLGLTPTGGRWGTIPMLREQMKRLFSSTISFQYEGNSSAEISGGFRIASRLVLFWDPKIPKQSALWESTIILTQEFYDEIIERPIPINMRALSVLKDSSLALDIYCWLTYRMSYLKNPVEVPWELLAMQFGSDYNEIRDFKKNFLKQLRKVSVIYEMKVEIGDKGLILKPSKPHIAVTKKGG